LELLQLLGFLELLQLSEVLEVLELSPYVRIDVASGNKGKRGEREG